MNIPIKDRVIAALLFESKITTLLLAACGYLFGSGLLLVTDHAEIEVFFNTWTWGSAFIIYAAFKSYQLFYAKNAWLKVTISTIGLWAWIYALLVFLVLDTTKNSATETLLLLPIICEMTELVIHTFHCKKSQPKDKQ